MNNPQPNETVDYDKLFTQRVGDNLRAMPLSLLIKYGVISQETSDAHEVLEGVSPYSYFFERGKVSAVVPRMIALEAALTICPHIMDRQIIKFVRYLTGDIATDAQIKSAYKLMFAEEIAEREALALEKMTVLE